MDNVTRKSYLAFYYGDEEAPCVGCQAEWEMVGTHMEREHTPTCPYLEWEHTEELAADNDKMWCDKCEKYQDVESSEQTDGFTGAPIYFINLTCGHSDVDASQDTLDWVK